MPQSEVDSSIYARALGRALKVKGGLDAPNDLDVSKIIPVVDVLQDGFAIYEILNLELVESMTASDNLTLIIFDPIIDASKTDNRQNNRDHEIRILFMEVQALGLTASQGFASDNRIYLSTRMRMRGTGPAIDGITSMGIRQMKRWNTNLAPDDFFWTYPSYSLQGGGPGGSGSDESTTVGQWNGWIPALTTFSIRIFSPDTNFTAGDTLKVRIHAVRVPKGCRLPN